MPIYHGFHDGSVGKESTFNAEDTRDSGSIPGSVRSPWRRNWQPTPVLPEKSHGQQSLVGYSPKGHKEPNVTVHTREIMHHPQGLIIHMFCNSD